MVLLFSRKKSFFRKLVWLYQATCWWGCARNIQRNLIMKHGDGNTPDLSSVLYPDAQLELNLVLHVCSTSQAPEISMHCLKKNPNTTPNHCIFSILLPANNNLLLLGSALLHLIMFYWLQLCGYSFKAGQESVCLIFLC